MPWIDSALILTSITGHDSAKILKNKSTLNFVVNSRSAYYVIFHIRLSQLFYNPGLVFITGADIYSDRALVVYNIMTRGSYRINIIAICCDGRMNTVEDLFVNAS
jgi:hypothetical protein